jgi:hypothetical protein
METQLGTEFVTGGRGMCDIGDNTNGRFQRKFTCEIEIDSALERYSAEALRGGCRVLSYITKRHPQFKGHIDGGTFILGFLQAETRDARQRAEKHDQNAAA